LNQDVDRDVPDQRAGGFGDILWCGSVEKEVAGFLGREPNRLGPDREIVANRAGERYEAWFAGSRDEGDDKAHRPSSYARNRPPGKAEAAPPVVIVAGPTASGKSALALALAEQFDGAVINADALQCYRDLEILTARPDAAALARAPHRLYGVLDAAARGSAGGWRTLALGAIADATNAGRLPIVVGGTGLYLRALQHGLAPFPEIPEAIRDEAAALHEALGGAAFRARLAALDPASAARLNPADSQRLVRAYAVARATGVAVDAWRRRAHPPAPYRFATILLMPPRDRLYAACDLRFAAMIQSGAVAEAAALGARELDRNLPAMKAVGLPELLRHWRGELTLTEAVAAAQRSTRRYAKRQMTWFRHQSQPDLRFGEQLSESLLRRSRQFIDEFVLTGPG
jgi:tRNA dimethylallyltransferase